MVTKQISSLQTLPCSCRLPKHFIYLPHSISTTPSLPKHILPFLSSLPLSVVLLPPYCWYPSSSPPSLYRLCICFPVFTDWLILSPIFPVLSPLQSCNPHHHNHSLHLLLLLPYATWGDTSSPLSISLEIILIHCSITPFLICWLASYMVGDLNCTGDTKIVSNAHFK